MCIYFNLSHQCQVILSVQVFYLFGLAPMFYSFLQYVIEIIFC